VALGLLLSTKYTALYTLPILLMMADVPFRHARSRRVGMAHRAGVAAASPGRGTCVTPC
jgi:hypothetical protein